MLICIHVHNYVVLWAFVKHLIVNVKPTGNPEVCSLLEENIASAAVSQHLYVLSYIQVQCYLRFWQLHSDFRNSRNGLCYVLKITIAKSDPDMELLGNMLL